MGLKGKPHTKYRVTGHKFKQIMGIQHAIRRVSKYFQGMNVFASYKDEEYKACHLANVHFPVGKVYIERGLHGYDFSTDRFKNGEIKTNMVKKLKTKPGYSQGSYEFDKRHIPKKIVVTKCIEAFLFSKRDKATYKVIQLMWIESKTGVAKVQALLDKKQLEFEKEEKIAQKKRQSIYLTDNELFEVLNEDEYYFADEKTLLQEYENVLEDIIEW